MRLTTAIVLVLAAVAAGVLPGCGGSDKGNTVGGQVSGARAAYVKRGNATCRKYIAQASRLTQPRTTAEGKVFLARLLSISRRSQAAFERLQPPAELRADHRRSVALGREVLGILERLRRPRAGDNPTALTQRLASATAESRRLNRRLGLDACNRSISPG